MDVLPGVLKTLDVIDGHSLASFEGSGSERQNDCLKRHKLLLLDSPLQEVCINLMIILIVVISLFRAKESLLNHEKLIQQLTKRNIQHCLYQAVTHPCAKTTQNCLMRAGALNMILP